MQLGAMLGGESHVGEHVGLGFIQEGGELGQLGSQLIGDLAPLSAGGRGIVLGKGGRDEGGDDAAALPAAMSQDVAHDGHAAMGGCGAAMMQLCGLRRIGYFALRFWSGSTPRFEGLPWA